MTLDLDRIASDARDWRAYCGPEGRRIARVLLEVIAYAKELRGAAAINTSGASESNRTDLPFAFSHGVPLSGTVSNADPVARLIAEGHDGGIGGRTLSEHRPP